MKRSLSRGFFVFCLIFAACGGSSSSDSSSATATQVTLNLQTSSADSSLSASPGLSAFATATAANYQVVCIDADEETIAIGETDDAGAVTLELNADSDHICTILNDDFKTLGVFVTDDSDRASGQVTTGLKPSGNTDLGTCTLDTDTGVATCDGTVPAGDIQSASTTDGVPSDLTVSADDPCGAVGPDTTLATTDLDTDGNGLPDLLDNDADGNGQCDNVDDLEKKAFCPSCDHVELSIDNAEHYCNPGNDTYRVDQRFYSDVEISSIVVEGPSWTDDVTIADSPSLPDEVTTYANWNDFNGKQLAACTSGDVSFHCMPLVAASGSLEDVMQEGDVFKYDITYADSTTATAITSINMVLRNGPEDVKIEGSEPACDAGTNGSFTDIQTSGASDSFTVQFTIPEGLQLGLEYRLFCTPLAISSGTTCTTDSDGTTSSMDLTEETTFTGDTRTSAASSQDSGSLTIPTSFLSTSSVNAWTCGIAASDDSEDMVDSHGYLIKLSSSTCTSFDFF